MENLLEYIDVALGAMASGPRNLRAYLTQPGPDFKRASKAEIESMIDLVLSEDPNNAARLRFSDLLRSWDNVKEAKWTNSTARNTSSRRDCIHEELKSGSILRRRIDDILPFYPIEEPVIIAEEHSDWYASKPSRDYYWTVYTRYLKERRSWSDVSVLSLDNSTRAIVECLANPESKEVYASRGLVMGYVQSGKTANFTGVAARAADAGYRLIIILAGTWNILRNQTQRRLDKELLGKELLRNDEFYQHHLPADWDEFLEHGFYPGDRGYYTWQRLTRPNIDHQRLKAAIDSLEFERRNKALPIYAPENLHALPVKLLVVKKHSGILGNLVKDLRLIRTRLTDLPALIIDDESDQAGINAIDPRRTAKSGKERTATNQAIVELLKLLPRGQYIGYTATPYANALVDPDDRQNIFPKDFIISLDRPSGYMGVSDFFDPATDYTDLPNNDFNEPEIAFIRRITNPCGEDDEDLKTALRSYVLAGAVKLYRQEKDPGRYAAEHMKHHTMLIHTSFLTGQQATLADHVRELWDECAFSTPKGKAELDRLWRQDSFKVSAAQGKDEIVPVTFSAIIPYLSTAIQRIIQDEGFIRVVNNERDEAPDFSAGPVWKIIIGGNKLSRGYTLEGLTVSYYRRVTSSADTLMQMGRWFGFRPGYRDLVRVFLGVREGKTGETDLVSLFKEVCLMEERFREEIKRYLRQPNVPRITPKQIPPLISVSGSLPPTARNKMFNAMLASKNFGGKWSQPTLTAKRPANLDANICALGQLLAAAKPRGRHTLGGLSGDGTKITADCILYEAGVKQLIEFLNAYRWLEAEYQSAEKPVDVTLQIDFLKKQKHNIDSWLIVAPQRQSSFGRPLSFRDMEALAAKARHRVEGRRFQVFGEPHHHVIAEFLVDVPELSKHPLACPNSATSGLRNKHRGIILLYPVREDERDKMSVGFELLFPKNDLPFDIHFTVRKKSERNSVVVKVNS